MDSKSNRSYKDSVFSLYMRDPARLIEVYNALRGTNYPPDTPIEINTLSGALYKNRINDISFILDGKFVVLIEHQSTINENMPVRLLIYLGRLYEQLLDGKNIYRGKRIPLEAPEFFVLYTGQEPLPEAFTLRLSDAFKAAPAPNTAEVTVKVLNAWYDEGKQLLHQSRALHDYSLFLYKVQEQREKGLPLSEAIHAAVRDCVSHDVMQKFLTIHASEVENMLFSEWDMETALQVREEEGIEEGKIAASLGCIKALVTRTGSKVEDAMELLDIPATDQSVYKELLLREGYQ